MPDPIAKHLEVLADALATPGEGSEPGPSGYRVHWQHPHGGHFVGEWWEDRATAEHMAALLRDSGWCLDVRIVRCAR